MIATTLGFSAIEGAAHMVTRGLGWLVAVTDHMVEVKHREETGEVQRQLVTLQLYITQEEFLDIAKSHAFERGLKGVKTLLENGALRRCPDCKTLMEDRSTD
jgi:hypothetical protein